MNEEMAFISVPLDERANKSSVRFGPRERPGGVQRMPPARTEDSLISSIDLRGCGALEGCSRPSICHGRACNNGRNGSANAYPSTEFMGTDWVSVCGAPPGSKCSAGI